MDVHFFLFAMELCPLMGPTSGRTEVVYFIFPFKAHISLHCFEEALNTSDPQSNSLGTKKICEMNKNVLYVAHNVSSKSY